MSASREKKNRQIDQPLTEKQRQEQLKAAAAKRNRVIYTVLGIVVAIAVIALLVWDSGVIQNASSRKTVALTVGEQSYTTPYVDYFVNAYYQSYRQYGIVSSLNDSYGEGQTWRDYFTEQAKETLTQLSILCDQAAKEGYTLTDADKADVETNYASYTTAASQANMSEKSFLKTYYGANTTPELLRSILEMSALAASYETHWKEQQAFSDSDITAYYNENANSLDTFSYDTITINSSSADSEDEAAKTAAMEKAKEGADAILSALESGEDVSALVEQYQATESTGLSGAGSSLSSSYAEFLQASGRQAGDATVVENSASYTVVIFQGRTDYREVNGYLPANVRHIFVEAEVSDGASEADEAQMAAAKAKAEELLAEWKAGEATADSFAALAEANSADAGSNTNGGLYEGLTKTVSFIPNFLDWTFEDGRQVGDTGIVENTQSSAHGYHVMYLDSYGDTPVWKTSITTTLRKTAFTEWYEALEASYTITDGSQAN